MKSVTKQIHVLSRAKGTKKAYNEINYVWTFFAEIGLKSWPCYECSGSVLLYYLLIKGIVLG